MKKLIGIFGATGAILVALLLICGPFLLTIYGLVLAFKASIILGIIVLVLEPSPFILGLLAVFGMSDIAQKIATWLNFPI